jgi:hypothetical protein
VSIPTTWILAGGAILGFTFALILSIPASLWVGWPRKRERELERDLCDAWDEIERLRALLPAENPPGGKQ